MAIVLFDHWSFENLLPLTFTRPVSEIRIGILTITEKWQKYLKQDASFLTRDYLEEKYPLTLTADDLFINGSICPDEDLLQNIDKLSTGEALYYQNNLIAVRSSGVPDFDKIDTSHKAINCFGKLIQVIYPDDIFTYNDTEIKKDFALLTKGRSSQTLSSTNILLGDQIFIEEGVEAECSSFNTKDGPIYLGQNSQVWEGSLIRGSFALCHDSQIKMGAKIYGGTTIGPFSRIGGEVKNAVVFGYSSKGHEGYLGNSIIGEWCNIGADSNNSNLKNNYSEVELWNYKGESFRKTGLEFCGLIMADHAKCGINTMFNTGTVVGVGANVFGGGFPEKFVPDFSWGGNHGLEEYQIDKMLLTAERVFAHKDRKLDAIDEKILRTIFELTKRYRTF